MTEGTVAATAGDRFAAAGSAGARSARNWASVSNIPVTISWRSWHSFRVSCSIARADSASCLSATPASSRVSRSRGQPAMTDAAIGGIGMPEFGAGTAGVPASSSGPAGCGCPAAPPSSTRSRRLRPPAFAAPVDGAIGGTESPGFEFTRRSRPPPPRRIAIPARTVKPRPARMHPMPPPSPRGRRQECEDVPRRSFGRPPEMGGECAPGIAVGRRRAVESHDQFAARPAPRTGRPATAVAVSQLPL